MHRIELTKNQAFLLEESNLQRILGIVHSSFGKIQYKLHFSVTLKSEKEIRFDSAEDVLRHDNTVADGIHHLVINAKSDATESRCVIFFFGEKKPHVSGIQITVESDEQRWASALAAELEEQIERLNIPGVVYRMRQSVRLRNVLSSLLIPIILISLVITSLLDRSKLSVDREEKRALVRLADAAKTTDEKLDFLFKAQVAALHKGSPDASSLAFQAPKLDAKIVMGLLPLLVVCVVIWYIFRNCYPPAIFAWGDTGKNYQRLLERRKNLWSIVFTVILLGFLVNISSPVVSNWLGL
jgi:hypothetical protein